MIFTAALPRCLDLPVFAEEMPETYFSTIVHKHNKTAQTLSTNNCVDIVLIFILINLVFGHNSPFFVPFLFDSLLYMSCYFFIFCEYEVCYVLHISCL